MKLIDMNGLKAKGIPYSRTQLWRKEREGTFPRRVKLGAARHGWIEAEIDAWLEERAAEREGAEAA